MIALFPYLRAKLALTLLLMCSVTPALALELNGSAEYRQLTRDFYTGGLYLPQPSSDPAYILAPSTAKKMQLVVTINRWSPRKWSRQWQNNISINNDIGSTSSAVQQALMTFTQFPKDDIVQGDEIIIDYQPGGNSRVLLNGDLIIETPGSELFNALVNTWIGKLPPSREFRQQMLGQSDGSLAARLSNHSVPVTRRGVYTSWLAADRAVEEARLQAEREAAAQRARAQQEQQHQAEMARLEAEARKREQARQQAEEQRLISARNEAERKAAERAKALREAQKKAAQAQAKTLVGKTSNALGQRKTAAILAEEQRYYLELLQWRLQREVNAEVSYPAWARQFGQEGTAQIDFTLNRERKVSNVIIRDELVSDLLTSELQRALEKTAAQTNIPAALNGEQWPLSVSYRFALAATEQTLAAMPEPPESISAAPLSAQQQERARAEYIAERQKEITARVEYPAAARILRKQGEVELEVDIARDGSLKAIRPLHPSSHRELNDALRDAIQRSAPFAPFADGLNDKQMTITVKHTFRL